MTTQPRTEKALDKTVEDSFPASDPPASTGITGPGATDTHPGKTQTTPIPTGLPTSDRYGAETAHHQEHQQPEEDAAAKA
jgi:hypothetical protein